MTQQRRKAYIVSDLHLGGAAPQAEGERGFQICTQTAALADFIDRLATQPAHSPVELVINGDFVDFLAEPAESSRSGELGWVPLREDEAVAQRLLETVVRRSPDVFAALRRLFAHGHSLTVLLGNHDIELAYPAVRKVLAQQLGVPDHMALRFLYDGEAYSIGNALIEHGNRYDGWNAIDYDALRRVCSLLSRGQPIPSDRRLTPPAGSQLVAQVMNPLKQRFPFVDLLKPESTAAVPLLLALDPSAKHLIVQLAKLALLAKEHKLTTPALPTRSGDISAGPGSRGGVGGELGFRSGTSDSDAALRAVLGEALGKEEASRFLQLLSAPEAGVLRSDGLRDGTRGDIAASPVVRGPQRESTWSGGMSWVKLLLASGSDTDARLPALRSALRAFCDPTLFHLDKESPDEPLYRAATELARLGRFQYVVMGHTHLARDLSIDGKGRYLNSGTWADLMCVPDEVFAEDPRAADEALRRLCSDIVDRRYDRLILQKPTYVRLELSDDKVCAASVETYRGGAAL
ncbi:MAG: metallophosphoesterase [Myxococcales bacterium]|nr:metallophosphoesterase [Myxococcales bacterium]